MAKVTADNSKLILPWVELGLAQLGLKKYPEARENSFKMALGIDPDSIQRAHTDDPKNDDKAGSVAPTVYQNAVSGGEVNNAQSRPDIKGVSWASLGMYVRTKAR